MTSPAAAEREALCDLFLEVGPDAPTLAGEWTTHDLAAHLVVRERRPDAGPGLVTKWGGTYTEKVRLAEAQHPYVEIVERVRSGPPLWSPTRLGAVDRLVNTIEFFVHHEDVRRAAPSWKPRTLSPELTATLDKLIRGPFGKALVRSCPVGLAIEPTGGAGARLKSGDPTVAIAGPIGEIVLFLYGRKAVADVELDGPPDAVEAVRAASFGI